MSAAWPSKGLDPDNPWGMRKMVYIPSLATRTHNVENVSQIGEVVKRC